MKILMMLGVLTGLFAFGCSGSEASDARRPAAEADDDDGDDEGEDEDDEQEVALDALPDAIRTAALEAVPGLSIQAAEKETENGVLVYDVEGTADGVWYEVEVTAGGDVLDIEHGPEVEDDDD